ncbi:MAG TPA: terpene cyclase/mutase family protein [Polyangiales bacterium]|nr:terpene cyclase/mutase family protein [Polyangiales bacterium]
MESTVVQTDTKSNALDRAISRAIGHLTGTQDASGAWLGDYGGPMFLVPLYLATCYGTGAPLDARDRDELIRYLRNTQNDDGGWGLHIESHSYQFTSTIIYAVLRLYDVPADDPALVRARHFVRDNGGPLAAASWGKFCLALLNLYDYRGMNPVPPELWILPTQLPFHPSRMWCHARMVYMPMSYLYGARVQMPVDDRVRAIRSELYDVPYAQVDWESGRDKVAASDDYTPLSELAKLANKAMHVHEALPYKPLRARALREVLEQIDHEDRNTDYVCLGPVNKPYNMWVWHHARRGGPEFQRHVQKLPEYLWRAEDGTKVQGYHSSQVWDTSFAVQALVASGEPCADALERANRYLDRNQVKRDLPLRERSYRDPTRGGWGFSNKDNGWIVSDCTAEALRATLDARPRVRQPISQEDLRAAVGYLLWSQHTDGGWASYEPPRTGPWLEKLNVASVFGDIMIDYTYVECTASSIMGLAQYLEAFPDDAVRPQIEDAIERGRDYLFTRQRDDGSWEGCWGICFTYGTWFALEGLQAAGVPADDARIKRAVSFLEQHQQADGGWGETAESNYARRYVHAESGQAVMTAWAVLGLIAAGRGQSPAVQRGVQFLIERQRADGSYPPERIAGMFNKTCAIHYDNYTKVFPLWALAHARAAH